ncbi:hypothetical protein J7T55_003966 [Diaporthe amygdali]|uniref:uncharacterized protein n=1 Tax=Phomopsis amygdali TaxID=1214568 RepID=UPI0022FE5F40|nr:uncharacterized protein J7T55_003966 [Diaporthe amygdali]KAJ0115797.1 hypothetical protein J7T55_003966 [Diaporthe amygdali]
MPTAFSQDFVQADRLIRRRYVQIPGKQKDLLERPDAWSENLIGGPRGMINVPPEVLQDVKDFHTRIHSKPTQRPSSTHSASPAESTARLSQDDKAADEATQLSWSPSPSRYPPSARPLQLSEQQELDSPSRSQPASQLPISQKRKVPPVPFDVAPPNSTAQSDAVPYEPLSALGQETHPPVNRGANRLVATQSTPPAATPPSAQLEVIPSTFNGPREGASEIARLALKRRRLGDTRLPDKENETIVQTLPLSKAEPRSQSKAPLNDQNSSTTSASTPSFTSQVASGHLQHSTLVQTASASGSNQRSSSNYAPTYEGRPRDTPTQQKTVLRHPASGSSMAPAPAQYPTDPSHLNLTEQPQTDVGHIIGHRTPYEEFKAAYPDYEESLRAFIRACLSVEKLEYERALPEFLYDDFVRVYSTLYMDYYAEAQNKNHREVLKATQWYNENVQDMVYTKKVIRRDNLPTILKAHAPAVEQIRESIRKAFEARPLTDDTESNEESDEDMADDGDQAQQQGVEEENFEPEKVTESRQSPEFHICSPGPEAFIPNVVGNDEMEEVHEPVVSMPASVRTRQRSGTVEEEHRDGSRQDDIAAPEVGSHVSRASPELHFQALEGVMDDEVPLKGADREMERTSPGVKSPTPRQTRRKTPSPATSALKSGSRQSRLVAPLPSSTPSSVLGNDDQPANDRTISPPPQRKAKLSSPAFRSQAESSDDESDSFDPPVQKAAMPPPRSSIRDAPAFLTQAQSIYEIPGTPDRLSEEPMPPPLPQAVARTPAALQSRTISGLTTSTGAVIASNPDDAGQNPIIERGRVHSRGTIRSSLAARHSPASSDRSRASVLFKKRAGETKEERSKRLKEHIRKRLSGKTPSSTPASTK